MVSASVCEYLLQQFERQAGDEHPRWRARCVRRHPGLVGWDIGLGVKRAETWAGARHSFTEFLLTHGRERVEPE